MAKIGTICDFAIGKKNQLKPLSTFTKKKKFDQKCSVPKKFKDRKDFCPKIKGRVNPSSSVFRMVLHH